MTFDPKHTSSGLVLVNESSELLVNFVIVGRVSAYRLKCGPAGNHIVNGMSPLEKAKYQFHITHPSHSDLATDYQAGITNLETLQGQVATTNRGMNMILDDITEKMIRFVRNVFTLRDNAVPDSPHGQDIEGAPEMDQETTNWPIPDEFAPQYDSIKYNFQPAPLPVFYKGNLIEPTHTNTALDGSIAEIEFTVRHWKIQDHDTFQATAENNHPEAQYDSPQY
ncbi:hypothetical protein EV702DRAFT_1051186 [Suillus placidus]|uniref:Uncharacterized protein n=1 Tax=Suillus placidus TaxID=48579 RepID=A0A9P7CVT9_9AGAM|nr:hypothetical protein EV702DRAFT_1051186 [Suillus placidus]